MLNTPVFARSKRGYVGTGRGAPIYLCMAQAKICRTIGRHAPDAQIGRAIRRRSPRPFRAVRESKGEGSYGRAGGPADGGVAAELALAVGDRLGGHIVSGHVDCVAEILSVRQEGESRRIRIGFPVSFGAEVIGKGSVALDGISLTVNDCGPDFLEVNVIPETWRVTTVAEWVPGTRINMETDVIGKYVRHMMAPHLGLASEEAKTGKLSVEFLRENGFF